MDAAELAELERRFLEAQATGKVRVLDPLPWRVRLRMWFTRRANGIGIWLCDHHAPGAAVLFWRACRMW